MIVVARVAGLVTVQDLGRPGHLHEAVPAGGALVPSLLVAANRRAGNADGAPALEIFGRATLRAETDVVIATDSQPAHTLHAGDELEVTSEPRRVAYVAPRGGIDVPVWLGGRGALVWAHMGPIVRSGDRLAVGGEQATSVPHPPARLDDDTPIRVIAGPDIDAFGPRAGIDVLATGPYRVLPASDRVGTRLAGPAFGWRADYVPRSRPMTKGAIEVPPDGQPIVLGVEHPATGGYPLAGVIAHDDLDRFFAARIGSDVRFTIR
jgi:allophanate hydrolase subunit 2